MNLNKMFALLFFISFIPPMLSMCVPYVGMFVFSGMGVIMAVILSVTLFKEEMEKNGKYVVYPILLGLFAGFFFGSFLNGFQIGFGRETKAYLLVYGIMLIGSIIGICCYEAYSRKKRQNAGT